MRVLECLHLLNLVRKFDFYILSKLLFSSLVRIFFIVFTQLQLEFSSDMPSA